MGSRKLGVIESLAIRGFFFQLNPGPYQEASPIFAPTVAPGIFRLR